MRILVSNPDTIGDLVLRQPLFRAILDAGHTLALVVRPAVAAVAHYAAPGADVIVLPDEVYRNDLDSVWPTFGALLDSVQAFGPDLLVVAPYQWTRFDELLADTLRATRPDLRVAGMSGHVWPGDPRTAGAAPPSRLLFDTRAEVSGDLLEVFKNLALGRAIGLENVADRPVLMAESSSLDAARATLAEHGLEQGGFWVACVGGTANVSLKTWPAENWGDALGHWATTHGRRFVFVGLPDEREVAIAVQRAMGPAADHSTLLMPETFDMLLAITSLSAGYVGHDTGPMHVAAACDKPVLAVFGGGTWPRFIPRAPVGVAITVGVPCAGCGWACAFELPHCIRKVPTDDVKRAIDDVEARRVVGVEQRVLDAGQSLRDKMILEGAKQSWTLERVASDLAIKVKSAGGGQYIDELVQLKSSRDQTAAELAVVRMQARDAGRKLTEADEENRRLRTESEELIQQVAAREQTATEIRREMEMLRQSVKDADARTAAEASGRVAEVAELRRLKEDAVARADAAELRAAAEADARQREVQEALRSAAEAHEHLAAESKARRDEVAALREEIESLRQELVAAKTKLGALAPPPPPPLSESTTKPVDHIPQADPIEPPAAAIPVRVRKSWREQLVDAYCGTRQFVPTSVPPPMPKIRLVTRVLAHHNNADVRATLASVIAEQYPHLEYVLAIEDREGTSELDAALDEVRLLKLPGAVAEYADRISAIIPIGPRPFSAVASAFDRSDADVFAWIDIGQTYEPGALMRIGEAFRDHALAFAIALDQTQPVPGGWRFTRPRVRLDVDSLRNPTHLFDDVHIAYRRQAYAMLGPIDPEKGHAAGWDLLIRFARRFGIRHGKGQSICSVPAGDKPISDEAKSDLSAAAAAFEAGFGAAGRMRCALLHAAGTLRSRVRELRNWRRRSFQAITTISPSGTRPAAVADALATPVSPVTHRRPDRLLFTGRDVLSGEPDVYRVYYDSRGDVAVSFPPTDVESLARHFTARLTIAGSAVVPPSDPAASPFRDYRGRSNWRWTLSTPSPYWRMSGEAPGGDRTAERLVSLSSSTVRSDNATARVLVAGCLDGRILDELKQLTRWRLTGTETTESLADSAAAKGHRLLRVSPQNIFMNLPDGELFNVILIPAMLEHWLDPAWVLRRLARVLTPTGCIVIRTPNLDSRLVELFGPTWWHWQLPYHHTLVGRRGLRQLATLADLKVTGLTTVTDAYAAAASVQLNQFGLGGVVPEGSSFSSEISAAGSRLAGWARLLWDPVGRGDEIWAVMRPL